MATSVAKTKQFISDTFLYIVDQYVQPGIMPLVERGLVPDFVLRFGMRRLLQSVIRECELDGNVTTQQNALSKIIADLKKRNIAEQTKAANQQHYEVPAELYQVMLGPWLKYSSGFWPTDNCTLRESEEAMLELVCERAELSNTKMDILDLGCGWGSCALYIAKKYPNASVTGVSNSNSQREFIMNTAKEMGLTNIEILTCDINDLQFSADSFDRVVSNEMFEHMKNYEKLMANIASWVKPGGKMFIHIFTHKYFTYHFEKGWMAETFFTGGTMPGANLLLNFQDKWVIDDQWAVNGKHYSKTLEAWLVRLDQHAKQLWPVFSRTYGEGNEYKWFFNWRLFNMACSELFRFNDGNEWFVSHYRFVKR